MSRLAIKKVFGSLGQISIVVIFLASIVSSGFINTHRVSAESASPGTGFEHQWPECSSDEQWYCVESASRDFSSIMTGEDGHDVEEGGTLKIEAWMLDVNSVNWAVRWSSTNTTLPDEVANQNFRFTLRTGELEPNFTYALSDEFYLTTGGNADDGYTLTIEATPARINWLVPTLECGTEEQCDAQMTAYSHCTAGDCGGDTTAATIDNRVISGNTQNMATWSEDSRDVWKGAYLSSNAQYRSTVPNYGTFPEPYWSVDIANAHLTVDEEPAEGSFTAWVPPTYFETLDTTAADAVANGFSINRDDDGFITTVPGAASLVDGGAYLRIPSISYSDPTLLFTSLDEGVPGVIKPGAPAATAISPKPGGVKVDWTAPHFNGGADITGYRLTCTQDDEDFTTIVSGSARTATITGMAGGVDVGCSVKAINSAGQSNRSNILTGTPNDPLTNEEDLNNDGFLDIDQPNLKTTTSSLGKTVVLELDDSCEVDTLTNADESANDSSDSGFDYLSGLVNFTASCDTPGQSTTVKLYYYHLDDDDFNLRKYNPNTNTYQALDDAEISLETIFGNQVLVASYEVKDGGSRDVDGLEDGTIVDPVGLASEAVGSPNTGLHN